MKKALVLAILGLITAVNQSPAAGHIYIWNYGTMPYNQVVWAAGQAVRQPEVQVQVWYGKGTISDPALLTAGAVTTIDVYGWSSLYDNQEGFGPGGYFFGVDQPLQTWQSGDTFTFQLRGYWGSPGSGQWLGSSVLWQERYAITPTISPASFATIVPRLTLVPEPSAFAFTVLSAASGFFFRRRNRGR